MGSMLVNEIKKRSKTGDYKVHGNVQDADCVVALSFGFRKDGDKVLPGLSNQDLASFIMVNYGYLPKLLQFEVAACLPAKAARVYRIEEHRKRGAYLDSREVASQAKEIMKQHGWTKALIIAHPYHMPRADAVCQKVGIRTIVPAGLEAIRFDPHSEQQWTRGPEDWPNREAKAIVYYAVKGWI